LPWEDAYEGANKYEKTINIAKKVAETSLEELCEGCPPEFKEYMRYCRALEFEEKPDYSLLIDLLDKCKTVKKSQTYS